MSAYTDSAFEPITYTTLNVAIDTAGSMRRVVIDDDRIQVGVGSKSWGQLEGFFTERGIQATITGPYHTYWESWSRHEYATDAYEIGISFRALALVAFDEPDQELRWGRALTDLCGKPETYNTRRYIPQGSMDKSAVAYCYRDLVDFVRRSSGGLPGEWKTVRTPVSVFAQC